MHLPPPYTSPSLYFLSQNQRHALIIARAYPYIRAPTVDVGYVLNAKYLAHIPHQTQFKPIYQMLYMLNFLQLATVKSQIYNCTDQLWYIGLLFFISLSTLISLSFLLQLTASISISTLPFFFFFPLPRCYISFSSPSVSFLPSLI